MLKTYLWFPFGPTLAKPHTLVFQSKNADRPVAGVFANRSHWRPVYSGTHKPRRRNEKGALEAIADEIGFATNRCHSLPAEGGFVPHKPDFQAAKMQSHVLWEFSCTRNHLAFHLFSPQSLYLPLKKVQSGV